MTNFQPLAADEIATDRKNTSVAVSATQRETDRTLVSSIDAGKTLCELSGWKMSNLRLQKVLYIAHMYHLGTKKRPLVKETFEAWMYGPVEPKLYRYCRFYGRNGIPNIFPIGSGVNGNSHEYETLRTINEMTKDISSVKLLKFTHSDKGAWKKVYNGGERGLPIPNDLIEQEHHDQRAG